MVRALSKLPSHVPPRFLPLVRSRTFFTIGVFGDRIGHPTNGVSGQYCHGLGHGGSRLHYDRVSSRFVEGPDPARDSARRYREEPQQHGLFAAGGLLWLAIAAVQ